MTLTPKQEIFIKFIENFIHKNNHSPSYMEISKGLNIKSIGTVSWYVSTLEKKGIIKRNYGYNGKRAITINNKKRELQYLTIANSSSTKLIPLYSSVAAGFPSPAEDHMESSLDLNQHLIKHPSATFYVYARGDSMVSAGISDGDMLIVDRSLEAKNGSIVVAIINGEFTVKGISKVNGHLYLMPHNTSYNPIKITEEMDFEIWGVVTHSIHSV
jgi:DNA polymerase V